MKLSFLRSWGLSFKFALAITTIVAGVAFTIGAVIVVQDRQRFNQDLEERVLLLARSVAVTAPEAILRNDSWFLYQSLKKMAGQEPGGLQHTRVITAMILSPEGHVLAHLKPKGHPLGLRLKAPDGEEAALLEAAKSAHSAKAQEGSGVGAKGFLEAVIPLFSDEKFLGVVRVRVSTYEVYLQVQRSALLVIGLTLGLVILGSLLGALISRRMVKPLTAMTSGLQAVRRGELTNIAPVPVQDNDELGELAAG